MDYFGEGFLFLSIFLNLGIDLLGYIYYYNYRATKSEVRNMSPRTGRPKSENPKSNPIHVRLDNETKEILDEYCQQEEIPKTEGIRRGIHKLKSEIKK